VESESIIDPDLPELPNNWLWVRAEQVCGFITAGSTPSAEKLFNGSGDIPFLKVYNLTQNGNLDFSINPTFISNETHENQLARSRVLPGDVLMNTVGPPLGKVSIVPDTYPEWNINQAIAIFRPIDGLDRKYLSLTLLTKGILDWAIRREKGTAGQSNLSLTICRNLPIPLPPLAEQERIVKRVEQLLSLCDALEGRLRSAEEERGRLVRAVMSTVGG
jgi:type I restriction enzyme S subunit